MWALPIKIFFNINFVTFGIFGTIIFDIIETVTWILNNDYTIHEEIQFFPDSNGALEKRSTTISCTSMKDQSSIERMCIMNGIKPNIATSPSLLRKRKVISCPPHKNLFIVHEEDPNGIHASNLILEGNRITFIRHNRQEAKISLFPYPRENKILLLNHFEGLNGSSHNYMVPIPEMEEHICTNSPMLTSSLGEDGRKHLTGGGITNSMEDIERNLIKLNNQRARLEHLRSKSGGLKEKETNGQKKQQETVTGRKPNNVLENSTDDTKEGGNVSKFC